MSDPTVEPAAEHYNLVAFEGAMRAFWSKIARSITLDESGISWAIKGQERRRAYREIRGIHLELRGAGLQIAVCRIDFVDGPFLQVHSGVNFVGGPTLPTNDSDGKERYVQFVDDLHRRLIAAGSDRVVFRAGEQAWRRVLARIMLVFIPALFIVLPIGIAVWRETWEPLKAVAAGVGATFLIAWLMRRNQPTTYAPDRVPRQYLP